MLKNLDMCVSLLFINNKAEIPHKTTHTKIQYKQFLVVIVNRVLD